MAGDARGKHLPGGNGDREIPGCDTANHANGIAHGNSRFVGQFDRDTVTEEPAPFTSHIVCHIDPFLHIPTGLLEDFTHLLRHGTCYFFFMLFEQFTHAKKNFTPFGGRHQSPFFKGCAGCCNGSIGFGFTREREVASKLTCSWLVVWEGLAAFCTPPFSSDVVL